MIAAHGRHDTRTCPGECVVQPLAEIAPLLPHSGTGTGRHLVLRLQSPGDPQLEVSLLKPGEHIVQESPMKPWPASAGVRSPIRRVFTFPARRALVKRRRRRAVFRTSTGIVSLPPPKPSPPSLPVPGRGEGNARRFVSPSSSPGAGDGAVGRRGRGDEGSERGILDGEAGLKAIDDRP